MSDLVTIAWVFVAGILLGILFFGGLWLTVKKALRSRIAVLWFLGSLILRLSIAFIGFYYIASGDWKRLLLALLGFVIARFIVMQYTKNRKKINNRKEELT